jgi:hypothetical protein
MIKKTATLFMFAFLLQAVWLTNASAAYIPVKGDLIKTAKSNTVYLVDDIGQRIPLSAGAFETRYNNNFGLIKTLTDTEVGGFTTHFIINSEQSHSSGSVVMYWQNPTIYLIENGYKRGFATWEAFSASGKSSADVHLVGEFEIYPTGQVIK